MPQTKTYEPGKMRKSIMRELLHSVVQRPHEHSWRSDFNSDSLHCEFFCGARIDCIHLMEFKPPIPGTASLDDPHVSGFLDLLWELNGRPTKEVQEKVRAYFGESEQRNQL